MRGAKQRAESGAKERSEDASLRIVVLRAEKAQYSQISPRRFAEVAARVAQSDTGKTIFQQTSAKLQNGLCKGDGVMAIALYNKLRGESDRCAKVLLEERLVRKQIQKGLDTVF